MQHLTTTVCLLSCFCAITPLLCQQNNNAEKKSITAYKSGHSLLLDGKLDEEAWQKADIATDFFMNKPFDTAFASLQTIVRVTFDDQFLYVGAVCYQPRNEITVSSLKRDFEGGASDVFVINIDPFKDGLNGFHFALSPYNVQREGLIDNGQNISNFWDNRWYSQVVNYDDRWEAEIAIPFKTLRYQLNAGENTWYLNFARNCLKKREISTWVPVPRNFPPNNLAFTGVLVWKDQPPKPGINLAIIPYVTGNLAKDYPRNETNLAPEPSDLTAGADAGLDVKLAVTPSLNLDLTFNPDFSQVEVDRQVTNLSRFELFFPERRQFFLENSDLFGFFGFPNARPFFSRRIGLAYNANRGLNEQVPILAGARLSGKLNEKIRIGFLNMQTRKLDFGDDNILPASNYSVAVLQHKVFTRSALGAVFVDKENFLGGLTESQRAGHSPFNRVAGLEFNYFSEDNKWETETYYHHSFSPNQPSGTGSLAQFVGYNDVHYRLMGGYQYIGANYRADGGFVPRPGIQSGFCNLAYIHNPGGAMAKHVNALGLGFEGNYAFDLAGRPLDHSNVLYFFVTLQDLSEGRLSINQNFTYLQDDSFDPTNPFFNPDPDVQNGYRPLPAGGYVYRQWSAGFYSSQRNDFTFDVELNGGQFFSGKQWSIDGNWGYRFQPYGVASVALSYNNINMPAPYNKARFYLIGPRFELTFTRSLFFTTFFQYNTQTNNVNINSRFQWRFRPVSDLFIVFTDNYFAEDIIQYQVQRFAPKNRTLVLKLTYWLNG